MRKQKAIKRDTAHGIRKSVMRDLYPVFGRQHIERDDRFCLSPKEFGEKLAQEAIKKIDEKVVIK